LNNFTKEELLDLWKEHNEDHKRIQNLIDIIVILENRILQLEGKTLTEKSN
jgi:hypothetical protein